MGIINPTGSGAWDKGIAQVLASSSGVIHSFPESQFRALRYVVAFYNTIENKTKTLEFIVNKESGTISTTVHNKLGKSISLGISAAIASGNLQVTVVNNETFDLEIEFGYLSLGRG